MDCGSMYVGETEKIPTENNHGTQRGCQRCLAWTAGACMLVKRRRCPRKRIMEHKGAVRRGKSTNGDAVHVHNNDHRIDWDEARIPEIESCYWKRRVLEALWICKQTSTMNLDCGLMVNPIWSNQMLQLLNWDLSHFHLLL